MGQGQQVGHIQQVLSGQQDCKAQSIYQVKVEPTQVPMALEAVHAGFPSVAQDYFSGDFSFDENVIVHPHSTFIIHVAGDSMTGAGIYDGDLLVVDRSLQPHNNDIVIAILNDELTVKRLRYDHQDTYLHAENPAYPDFHLEEGEELVIWGVVTGNYHWQREQQHTREHSPVPNITYPQSSRPARLKNNPSQQAADSRTRPNSAYSHPGWDAL